MTTDPIAPALREAVRLASAGYAVLWQLGIDARCPGDVDALLADLRALPGTVPAGIADQLAGAVERVRSLDVEALP